MRLASLSGRRFANTPARRHGGRGLAFARTRSCGQAGGHLEYGAALGRLMAHCGLVDEAPNPPAPRLYHENLGHGAGLMSSHNQMPCGACGSSLSLPLYAFLFLV